MREIPHPRPLAIRAFVLVKDEAENLPRSIPAMTSAGFAVTVLDSGSTDGSQALAAAFDGVDVVGVEYRSHADSYNEILTKRAEPGEWILILDADMILSLELAAEMKCEAPRSRFDVLKAPVEMWWAGHRLEIGSLYPPKAIAFRAGQPLFVASGHGERLVDDSRSTVLRHAVVHDDWKAFGQTLVTQARYGSGLAGRVAQGRCSARDRIRARWPIFVMLTPLWSFCARGPGSPSGFPKGGWFSQGPM